MVASEPLLTPKSRATPRHDSFSVLLGDAELKPEFTCDAPAHVGSESIRVASTNIVLAVLGAGQLTLPYAMSELGWIFGLVTLLVLSLMTYHSLHTLSVYSMHFKPCQTHCIDSYAEHVVRVLGAPGKVVCIAIIAIYAWGGALSFLVILKSQLDYLGVRAGLSAGMGGTLMGLCACGIIWPLSASEDLSALKKFSPLGCLAAIFVTFVVLVCTPWSAAGPFLSDTCSGPSAAEHELRGAGELKRWPESFLSVAASVPLLSFALNASWAYVPVLCTLKERSPSRAERLIFLSLVIIVLNYLLISVYGYATFCAATEPNILDSLGSTVNAHSFQGGLLLVAKVMLSVQLTLALPMRFFMTRKTLFGENLDGVARWLITGAFVMGAACLAAMPLPLNTVMGITSSICASMIIYILPSFIDLRLQLPGRWRKMCSAISLPIGLFVLLGGTLANVLGVAVGS